MHGLPRTTPAPTSFGSDLQKGDGLPSVDWNDCVQGFPDLGWIDGLKTIGWRRIMVPAAHATPTAPTGQPEMWRFAKELIVTVAMQACRPRASRPGPQGWALARLRSANIVELTHLSPSRFGGVGDCYRVGRRPILAAGPGRFDPKASGSRPCRAPLHQHVTDPAECQHQGLNPFLSEECGLPPPVWPTIRQWQANSPVGW